MSKANFWFGNRILNIMNHHTSTRYYDSAPNFHDNLYWSLVPGDEELPKFPDKLSWAEWQAWLPDGRSQIL